MENENPPNEDNANQIPLADTQYARTARDLNDIVNRLRQCGANADLGLSLPMIAVIGNQSVGKSSLIEAISEIQVPRSMGTCTRCPTEVRLRTAVEQDQWACKVLVQLEDGGRHKFFDETKHRKDVESILRRAQLAILNPDSDDVSLFAEKSDEECAKYEYVLGNARPMEDAEAPVTFDTWDRYKSETSFSKNSIVVEITGADVDVTFIDLPGLIRNGVCLLTIKAEFLGP
jgi:GTPase SAR1 family protein